VAGVQAGDTMKRETNILRDVILARAVRVLDNDGDPSAAQSIETLRDVLTDEPTLAASLERKMAARLIANARGAQS
jgi:hypothetical protein